MAGHSYCFALAAFAILGAVKAHSVCYPVYGCFSDDDPFHRATGPLPQAPATLGTMFFLYTRTHAVAGQLLDDMKNETVAISDFQPGKRTVIVTHGYLESISQFWFPPFIKVLLEHDDINVITVGWGNGAKFPYHFASSNTRLLGAQITHLLDVIHDVKGLDHSNVHLIAFSVGAHAMGYVGRNFRRRGIAIGRITGLDPAAPYFEFSHPDVRLDPTDANFVDVIHSNSRVNGIFSLGCETPLGHVDFYPNGGKYQPGCPDLRPEVPLDLANLVACSHYRSILLYVESINKPPSFQSYPCSSWDSFTKGLCVRCKGDQCPTLGHFAEKNSGNETNGSFYLRTFDRPAYNGVHYRITFYTGIGLFADLDAQVDVTLEGTNFTSAKIPLKHRYLAHGSKESFVVIVRKDIGEPKSISVKINSYIEYWYLDKVEIIKLPTQEVYGGCYKTYVNSFNKDIPLFKGNPAC